MSAGAPVIRAAPGGDAPVARPTSRPAEARPIPEIEADLNPLRLQLGKLNPPMDALFDPANRAEVAPKVLPTMRQMLPLMDEEIAAIDAATGLDASTRAQLRLVPMKERLDSLGLMSLLGDADALKELRTSAQSTSREEAVGAKAWLYGTDWAKSVKDPIAQEKVAAEFAKLAGTNLENDVLTQVAFLMVQRPASPALGERIEDVVINTLRGDMAKQFADSIKKARLRRAVEGKALVIDGTTHDGADFSSSRWKGKVVVVQFWATPSPSSMAELPKLKKLYRDYHAKGLEIVGVSGDRDPDNFKAFLQDNPDMPWPQLLDPDAPNRIHPLFEKFGVEDIPSAFVIDKKGVCRTVHGREKLEETVQKLLAE